MRSGVRTRKVTAGHWEALDTDGTVLGTAVRHEPDEESDHPYWEWWSADDQASGAEPLLTLAVQRIAADHRSGWRN